MDATDDEWIAVRDDPFRLSRELSLDDDVASSSSQGEPQRQQRQRWRRRPPELCFRVVRVSGDTDAEPRFRVSCRFLSGAGNADQSAVFTCPELAGVHAQLSRCRPSLSDQMPELPEPPRSHHRSLWAYLSSPSEPVVGEESTAEGQAYASDALCCHLIAYLEVTNGGRWEALSVEGRCDDA